MKTPKTTELRIFSVDCTAQEFLKYRQQLVDAGAAVLSAVVKENGQTQHAPLLYAAAAKVKLDTPA